MYILLKAFTLPNKESENSSPLPFFLAFFFFPSCMPKVFFVIVIFFFFLSCTCERKRLRQTKRKCKSEVKVKKKN